MKNLIKGIIIGIAKVIPGLSGAVLMISFHLYDKAIYSITHFFDDVKRNFWFLLELGIGIMMGIVLFSKVVVFFLQKYYLYTNAIFIGLILGGIPVVARNFSHHKKNIMFVLFSFFLTAGLSIANLDFTYEVQHNGVDLVIFFLSGVLEAIGTVIPGVSSTALLMLMGVYSYYITIVSHILSISMLKENLFFLLPFSLGLFLGMVIVTMLVNYLFEHYKEQTFAVILGFSFSSVFLLIVKLFPFFTGISSIIVSLILFLSGYFVTSKL